MQISSRQWWSSPCLECGVLCEGWFDLRTGEYLITLPTKCPKKDECELRIWSERPPREESVMRQSIRTEIEHESGTPPEQMKGPWLGIDNKARVWLVNEEAQMATLLHNPHNRADVPIGYMASLGRLIKKVEPFYGKVTLQSD